MEIATAYMEKSTKKHYLLLKEGMHRVEDGKPITLSEYSAKAFSYDEDSEPSVEDLMKEWGVTKAYFDRLAASFITTKRTH